MPQSEEKLIPDSKGKQDKKPYQRPHLTLYGEFRDFTKGSASGPAENSSGTVKKP